MTDPIEAALKVEEPYFRGMSVARALKEVRLTTYAQRSQERNRKQARACRSPYRRAGIAHVTRRGPR